MNPTELELFLYRHTESESWHLQHPGQLSHIYDEMKQEKFRGEVGYCFDFVNTLKKDMIGMIKETRFTVIPKHHHVDMELNYIYSGSCTFVINGREITLKKGDLCILDSDVWHSATSYKKEHDIVINIVFRRHFFDGVFLSRLSQQEWWQVFWSMQSPATAGMTNTSSSIPRTNQRSTLSSNSCCVNILTAAAAMVS